MKTKKRPTRKEIQTAIREQNTTKIFMLCKLVNGTAKRGTVCQFIEEHAPTLRLKRAAWRLSFAAHFMRPPHFTLSPEQRTKEWAKEREAERANVVQRAAELFRRELRLHDEGYKYARPLFVHNGRALYLATAAYGLQDYNKTYVMPVVGNERAVMLLCSLSERVLAKRGVTL